MPRTIPAIAVLLTVVLAACGGGNGDDEATPTSAAVTGALASPTATPESSAADKPTEVPTPAPGEVTVANEAFSVEAADGTVLKGHLYSPDGPKRHALIIAAPVEQSVWADSTEAFTSRGIAVFTFDPRGFGETGGSENPATLATDVLVVSMFVRSRDYPLIYLMAVGPAMSEAARDGIAQLDVLAGLITHGYGGETPPWTSHLALTPREDWQDEDLLADAATRDAVLAFIFGRN